jgi:hypothetical protein
MTKHAMYFRMLLKYRAIIEGFINKTLFGITKSQKHWLAGILRVLSVGKMRGAGGGH